MPEAPGDFVVKSKLSPHIGYVVGATKVFFNSGNNHYSITQTAPIIEYLIKHGACFVYTVGF